MQNLKNSLSRVSQVLSWSGLLHRPGDGQVALLPGLACLKNGSPSGSISRWWYGHAMAQITIIVIGLRSFWDALHGHLRIPIGSTIKLLLTRPVNAHLWGSGSLPLPVRLLQHQEGQATQDAMQGQGFRDPL